MWFFALNDTVFLEFERSRRNPRAVLNSCCDEAQHQIGCLTAQGCHQECVRMPFYIFHWTKESLQHIAEHGVTQDEFAEVVMDATEIHASRSSGLPIVFGTTSTGKRLACVFEGVDEFEVEVIPVTAFEV